MNNKKLSVFAFLSFCLQASLSEAHTFNSTRPGTGTGVTFVSGKIDLVEAGFEFRKSNPEESHDFETNAFPDLLLRFGLSEKMDLS
ncbi:MAG TPA: hypothetical protein PLC47_05185, partial [Bacteroidales bacterium]|nr:hypothetical protein [Bacteroidales bacterium]